MYAMSTYGRRRHRSLTTKRPRNHNLEEQAQVLYRSWFVDFEPFKDGGFVDSEMGPIPNGWRIGRINDIINIQSGFAFKSESFEKEGTYKLITISSST